MPARRVLRRVALESFVSGGELQIDIPRIQDIYSLVVVVDGSLDISGAASSSVPADSPSGLIQRVDLVANGKDVLDQLPFVFATQGNYGRRWNSELTAPGTTVGNHPIRAVGYLDRVNYDGPRPKDSAFQAYLTQLLQLRLTLGTADDIISKGSATVSVNAATTVEVLVDSYDDTDRGEPKAVKKRTFQSQSISGANSDLRFDLPVGNFIRLVEFRATDNGAPSDTLINSLELAIDGVDVRQKTSYDAARSVNRADRDGTAPPSGFVVMDASPAGKLSELWDLTRSSEAQAKLDVAAPSGTGKIEMIVEEFIIPGR